MCATRSNLCFGVIPRSCQDGRHHTAAYGHSKYRVGRMTQCKMGRFLSTSVGVCACAEGGAPVCVTSDRLRGYVRVRWLNTRFYFVAERVDVCFYYHMTGDCCKFDWIHAMPTDDTTGTLHY